MSDPVPDAKVDVVIVGAGPVGLLVANLLGQRGVSVSIVDAAADVMEIPRAISLDHEALRILQATGLADELAAQMPAVPHVEVISPRGLLARVNAAGTLDGHPRLVCIYQPGLERVLRAGLRRHGSVELIPSCTYLSHREEADGVVVRLRQRTSEREVGARFLIGCDGAKSAVRQAMGWKPEGSTYAQDWLIVDATRPPTAMDHVEFICDPRRPIAHVPGPDGTQRWEFMLMPGETAEEMLRPERVAELLRSWGEVDQMKVVRAAVYRFHARLCNRFGAGRVFVAGDAAHLTPPFAGQGLCSGIRDAANLSWKLAAVVRGEASADVLGSYEIERRPHARSSIRLAVVMGMIIMPTNRVYALFKDTLLAFLLRTPLRSHLTDVKLRPKSRYREGLFLRDRPAKTAVEPGALFAQHLVRNRDGEIVWSDDVLGPHLVLVGMGVDPCVRLSPAGRVAWSRVGGRFVLITNQQQRCDAPAEEVAVVEDVTGQFVTYFGHNGLVAAVRPDRTVLGVCDAEQTEALVVRLFELLRPTRAAPALVGAQLSGGC
ncbi:MAG: bifunctional 3-(3-hydroxy-phenyl)propionate/3-hydroxycinnamic acid hydroxylase [bacterium]|nr:bifunctional 3-(3-hydroxy-phenyl)propionate/3-hydroxycinnamic acid hydroxylase [bacterium]